VPTPRESKRWTTEQFNNARVIASVGKSLGASDRDILIAIMTGFQESGLRNLNYGDRDSIGMFQQRNAWGSTADRLNPYKSARMFFLGGAQGQRGLLDYKQRNGWSLTQAAQKVQVSAYPNAYAKHEKKSRDLLAELGTNLVLPQPQDTGQTQQAVAPNQPLDTMDLSQPAGMDAASVQNMGMPAGVAAATAPGIESADEMPEFDLGSNLSFLDSADATTPSGGSTFQDMFPQKPGVTGGARERVGQLSRQLLGIPYVWGGTDPDKGLDCSGFTQYVYKQMGISLPRISNQQARFGKRIGLNQLQVGDMVAWDNSSRNNGADHIAIYLGNGQIIEAPRPGLSVRIRQLDNDEDAWGVQMKL